VPTTAPSQINIFANLIFFHNLKFKLQFFGAKDVAQIKLPELTGEAKGRPTLIEINDEFQTDGSP